jgi:hypothetical protein
MKTAKGLAVLKNVDNRYNPDNYRGRIPLKATRKQDAFTD